jgi:hypothetical protein
MGSPLFSPANRPAKSQLDYVLAVPRGFAMFEVRGWVEDCRLTAKTKTAKEAFAKAVEWQVAHGIRGLSISDGYRRFTVAEFSWTMASAEITETVRRSRLAAPAYPI